MKYRICVMALMFWTPFFSQGQNIRTQYPVGLRNAYFGVNLGAISYPFSDEQLEPGYRVNSVHVPHAAVRIVLYGMPITKNLSARITYMRPVKWVEYRGVNGDVYTRTVWMNIAGLTLNGRLPLTSKFSLSAEAGLGVITRNGFELNGMPVVKNASYGTGLFGGSANYLLNKKWELQVSAAWSPANKNVEQPATFFLGAGFNYYLRPLPESKAIANSRAGHFFPGRQIMIGITTNAMGYGVNEAVSKGPVPIFWGGDAQVKNGISVNYQKNIFHAKRVFALDWAAGFGVWNSRDQGQKFFTASLNPVFRFHAIRSRKADIFLEYSVAGPTYISQTVIDRVQTGKHFTFHDFMGIGTYAGLKRNIYAGLRIAHYSNGNIFPQNDGVMIPLTFNLGYVLK